jgi:hypothetical protein
MAAGDWLYIEEYAKRRCHRVKTFKSYIQQGMPHYKDGNRISVNPDDADRWLILLGEFPEALLRKIVLLELFDTPSALLRGSSLINKRIGGDNLIDSKPVVSENEAIENILKRKKQRGHYYEN